MSNNFDSIFLAGQSLRPAPFVSTTYEYNKFNGFIVGGFLIVTLSGTLVDKDINAKIANLNALQSNQDCVSLTIGCADNGGKDFLDGSGRIRSVDINQTEQPYVANYTIVIVIETLNGQPVVEADPDFATSLGLPKNAIPSFVQGYEESITIDGNADVICSRDSVMSISKGYVKASGSINIKVYTNYICGFPSNNPSGNIEAFLQARSSAIISGGGTGNPISSYSSWSKWLDTKSLEIKMDGNVTWTFDLYMTPSSSGTLMAFVDANTTDRLDQKTLVKTRNISGSIKGLSSATIGDHIGHKADTNERMANAEAAFGFLDTYLRNGTWPGSPAVITGIEGTECNEPVCQLIPPVCFQRISHSLTKSVVNGEISFNMEFGDINACQPPEFDLEVTIDDTFPAAIHQEIIIPNRQIKPGQFYPRSIIQVIADQTRSVTITIRGSLIGCDKTKLEKMINCARARLIGIINLNYPDFANWRYKSETETVGSFSYTIRHDRIRCDFIV